MPAHRTALPARSASIWCAIATLAFGVALSAACTQPARPNLLLVTLDTTRADRLGPYGFASARTPALDAFARNATLYEHAYATSSWTLPSHASLFTGLLPMQHGAQTAPDGDDTTLGYAVRPLAESFTTLAERLRGSGYRTGAVIAGPALRRELGVAQGFEHYDDDLSVPGDRLIGRRAEDVTDRALAQIEAFGAEPWFLFVNYFDPHAPYRPPPPLDAKLEAVDRGPLMRAYLSRLERGGGAAPQAWERDVLDALLAGYDAEIAYMDRHLGRLLARVESLGPTWIAITADHGESFGEHSHLSHGAHLYEDNVRVPLLVRESERRSGATRVARPISNHALFAAALAAAGLRPPLGTPQLDDRPVPIVLEVGPSDANVRLFGPYFDRRLHAVVEAPHKLVRSSRDPDELYDLSADPGERNDLATLDPDRRDALRAALARVREAHPPLYEAASRAELREDTEDALRALGYLEPEPDSESESEAEAPGAEAP